MNITLASSSTYRQSILKKLHIPFTFQAPNIDESRIDNETIICQVGRLAREKALAVSVQQPNNYVIGSDQLASFNGKTLGKPGDFNNAKKQLMSVSGQTVTFYTALCLIHAGNNHIEQTIETYDVTFKTLSNKQITTYLQIEKPYNCAGSFKSEGLGISLFDSLNGRDPNSLIGLPLIALIELFANIDIDIFDYMLPQTN